jgi:hypothetical protein
LYRLRNANDVHDVRTVWMQLISANKQEQSKQFYRGEYRGSEFDDSLTQVTLRTEVTFPFLFGKEVKCLLLSTLLLHSSELSPFSASFSRHIFKFCTHLQCPLARSLSCTSLGFGCTNVCEGYKHNCESAHYADVFTVFGTDIFLSTTFPQN